jgi:hypothetical protein
MKSIDAVKKIPAKNSNRRTVKKLKPSKLAKTDRPKKNISLKRETKASLMWLSVGCFMVLVVMGWVFFLRSTLANDLNTRGGGFEEIAKGFNRLFHTIDRKFEGVQNAFTNLQKAQMNLIEEDGAESEIQELREKVFPQFENINTNSNI